MNGLASWFVDSEIKYWNYYLFVRILSKEIKSVWSFLVLISYDINKLVKFLHSVLFLDGGADVSGTAFGGIGGGGGAGAPLKGALLLITAGWI